MGAPKGNSFWELRSKHGRDKLFTTPELMWQAACEYFQWCQDNPFFKREAKTVNIGDYQSEIQIAEIPQMRPFTMHGLCSYLNCNTVYFNHFEKDLGAKQDELSKGFRQVITRIRETIYQQKFEGAAIGVFNANIIARDLGLVDKQENKVDGSITITGMKIT